MIYQVDIDFDSAVSNTEELFSIVQLQLPSVLTKMARDPYYLQISVTLLHQNRKQPDSRTFYVNYETISITVKVNVILLCTYLDSIIVYVLRASTCG